MVQLIFRLKKSFVKSFGFEKKVYVAFSILVLLEISEKENFNNARITKF